MGVLRSKLRLASCLFVLSLAGGSTYVLAQKPATPEARPAQANSKTPVSPASVDKNAQDKSADKLIVVPNKTTLKPLVSPLLVSDVPRSVDDLREMQTAIQKVLPKMLAATVCIQVGTSSGSGVIVDKEGHVLTAAHVVGSANRPVTFILPNGKILKGKTLGANLEVDAGLMQITDKVDFPYMEMGDYSKVKTGVWCICVGHPGGYQRGRDPVVRFGRVLRARTSAMQTDCTITPGDSGGPLYDLQGRVIGIHSRIGDDLTANVHVPISAYKDDWQAMLNGDVWSKDSIPYLGISPVIEIKDKAQIGSVRPDSPAEKAGLRDGDIILKFNNVDVKSFDSLTELVRKTHPGSEIKMVVKRGTENVHLTVKIGQKPTN